MTDEKSMEELEAELKSLKEQNLKRDIANEQAKLKEAEELSKNKAEEKLRSEIRAEVIAEMGDGSKVTTADGKPSTATTLQNKMAEWENFSAKFKDKFGYGGKTYEDIAKSIGGW